MTRRLRLILVGIVVVPALGACHQQPKGGHGEVSGQILPGSVSDAMLPYDTVKSKGPLAPRQAAGSEDNAPDNSAADTAETAAASDSAVPDAGASPSPTPPAAGN